MPMSCRVNESYDTSYKIKSNDHIPYSNYKNQIQNNLDKSLLDSSILTVKKN
jgi:hypothetical protein